MDVSTFGRLDVSPRIQRGAIGVISQHGRYLMIRRAAGVAKGGCWCFPGGHVEPGETSRRAIQREFAEELGVTVLPVRRVGSVRVADSNHVLVIWTIELTAGVMRPAPEEIAEFRWVTAAEVSTLTPGLPSNATVLEMLAKRQ